MVCLSGHDTHICCHRRMIRGLQRIIWWGEGSYYFQQTFDTIKIYFFFVILFLTIYNFLGIRACGVAAPIYKYITSQFQVILYGCTYILKLS